MFFRSLHQSQRCSLGTAITRFLQKSPYDLPIVSRSFSTVDLANLHRAIIDYKEKHASESQVIGYTSAYGPMQNSLRDLMAQEHSQYEAMVGPVQYRSVDVDVNQQMECLESGVHLIATTAGPLVAHVHVDMMRQGNLELEVMSQSQQLGAEFIEQVRRYIAQSNIYRHKVISLECDAESWGRHGSAQVRFHQLAPVSREAIILPEENMELIERNTTRFLQHAERLRHAGRSLKRGLLFHGKPGTGKTFTAKWLAQTLPDTTVILISGEQLWAIKQCCQMARALMPALIIMEDVDLIATERNEQRHPAYQITLHQLLNEMDGIGSEAEILFILTTNRPDALEEAVAARPGRIDQAIEFPLPDAGCRRRLFELYAQGLKLELQDFDRLITRTAGASPAFIQELVRKAALFAAEATPHEAPSIVLHLQDGHFEAAMREMIFGGGALTRNLLGFQDSEPGRSEHKDAGTT